MWKSNPELKIKKNNKEMLSTQLLSPPSQSTAFCSDNKKNEVDLERIKSVSD